jgi:hypothetical protein
MPAVVHDAGLLLQKILRPLFPWRRLLDVLIEDASRRGDSVDV